MLNDDSTSSDTSVEPIWCAVANAVHDRPFGPGHENTRRGTKHFAPGTKLYIVDWSLGDGLGAVLAIGRHRGSSHLVRMWVDVRHVENPRPKLAYSPRVIELAREHREGAHREHWRPAEEAVRRVCQYIESLREGGAS